MITAQHPEWPEFRDKHIVERITELHGELENWNLTIEQTAAIRGEIAGLRRLRNNIEAPDASPQPTFT
jgi:hypothetical protein